METIGKLIGIVISLTITYALILFIGVPLLVLYGGAKSSDYVDSQLPIQLEVINDVFTPNYLASPRFIRDRSFFYDFGSCKYVLSKDECANSDHYTLREYINHRYDYALDRADAHGLE